MDYRELAERCRHAKGPDRDIDKAIAWGGARIRDEDLAPRYTRSLDAALKLVPRGWTIELETDVGTERHALATLRGEMSGSPAYFSYGAATLPLALTAVSMRVRAAIAMETGTAIDSEAGVVAKP